MLDYPAYFCYEKRTDMAERKQESDGGSQRRKEARRERRAQFSLVTFAAWTEEASGQHLITPESEYASGSTSGMYGEAGRERALQDLAEGGYVIDLRPLAEHPQFTRWVFDAPLPDGRIEGEDIERLPDRVRHAAGEMAASPFGLQGAFHDLAIAAFARMGEPLDGSTGMFDKVSAAYLAMYWGSRGARIGKRVGESVFWLDGTQQAIAPHPQESSSPERRNRPTGQ